MRSVWKVTGALVLAAFLFAGAATRADDAKKDDGKTSPPGETKDQPQQGPNPLEVIATKLHAIQVSIQQSGKQPDANVQAAMTAFGKKLEEANAELDKALAIVGPPKPPATTDGSPAQMIEAKMQQLQAAIQALQSQKRDPAPLVVCLAGAQALVQTGHPDIANGLLDLGLSIVGQGQGQGGGQIPDALKEVAKKVQEGLQRWQQAGRDVSPVVHLVQEAGQLVQQGKIDDAKRTLEQAVTMLDSVPAK